MKPREPLLGSLGAFAVAAIMWDIPLMPVL